MNRRTMRKIMNALYETAYFNGMMDADLKGGWSQRLDSAARRTRRHSVDHSLNLATDASKPKGKGKKK